MDIHKRRELPRLVAGDFVGLSRAIGPLLALRWVGKIASHWRQCRRAASFGPADEAMGAGPFSVDLRGARAQLLGDGVFGGLREIWARDVYLAGGYLSILADGVVLDLGANMGNFTLLALAHGSSVRVVCVEAITDLVRKLERGVEFNGWSDRATVVHAFIGGRTETQDRLSDEKAAGVPFISTEELIDRGQLSRIDYLKCDIEGSEHELLSAGSPLLAMAQQIAIEVHKWVEPAEPFLEMLRGEGFDLRVTHESPFDVVVLGRRSSMT